MNSMFKLESGTKVIYYPYRRAQVFGCFFRIDRNTKEAMDFEEKLSRKAGQNRIDNHTVYTISNNDGSEIHVSCSGDSIRFGSILKQGLW